MGQLLAVEHLAAGFLVGVVGVFEIVLDVFLGVETLDNPYTGDGLVKMADDAAHEFLGGYSLLPQPLGYGTYRKT